MLILLLALHPVQESVNACREQPVRVDNRGFGDPQHDAREKVGRERPNEAERGGRRVGRQRRSVRPHKYADQRRTVRLSDIDVAASRERSRMITSGDQIACEIAG